MPKLAKVNTDNIGGAIRLGCRTMCRVFNADDGDIPFFGSCVWPQPELVLQHPTRDIRVRLRGDQAVAMDNVGADWTLFDPID